MRPGPPRFEALMAGAPALAPLLAALQEESMHSPALFKLPARPPFPPNLSISPGPVPLPPLAHAARTEGGRPRQVEASIGEHLLVASGPGRLRRGHFVIMPHCSLLYLEPI